MAEPKKPSSMVVKRVEAARSLPENVPDWSKIVVISESDNGNGGGKPPPSHEFPARRGIMASTLMKERDPSRVRSGIWEKIGFNEED
ncbi:hypothetical protein SSX86_000806 [Deinandra increscens subsp. villosa]|uniref:Uncharacterized protein n=1 Tax=Deinandra increscens subsp. villosa TaxID=3103831 RepID=A0AAP0DQ39_9ASTR